MGDEADLDQITEVLEHSATDKDGLAELSSEDVEEKSSEEINDESQEKLYEDPITEEYKTRTNNNVGGRAWEQEEKEHFRLTILD